MGMKDDDKNRLVQATPEEQDAAFQRARGVLEAMNPVLDEYDVLDQLTALQMRIAQLAVRTGRGTEGILTLINVNIPPMMKMWEQAYSEVQEEDGGGTDRGTTSGNVN